MGLDQSLTLFRTTPNRSYNSADLVDVKNGLRCSALAKRALLAAYGADLDEEEGPENGIADLIADLRHLCDRLHLDYAELDQRAYSNYSEEAKEDSQPD